MWVRMGCSCDIVGSINFFVDSGETRGIEVETAMFFCGTKGCVLKGLQRLSPATYVGELIRTLRGFPGRNG